MTQPERFDEVRAENLAILGAGIFRGKQQVFSYVDLTTGQVVPPDTARSLGVRSIRDDARQRRRAKLATLRPEVRRFALFLLRFRNAHCQFLLPVSTLVMWFATLSGMQACHVRRYFKPLIAGGILESDSALNEDFMVNNPKAGRETAKGDETRAYIIYLDMQTQRKWRSHPLSSDRSYDISIT